MQFYIKKKGGVSVSVSSEEVIRHLMKLNSKEMRKVDKKILKRCATILLIATRKQIRRSVHNAGLPPKHYPTDPPLAKQGATAVDQKATMAKVHFMKRVDWLSRILILGTAPRYTHGNKSSYETKTSRRYRSSVYRGSVTAMQFFKNAQAEVNARLERTMETERAKAIEAAWARKSKK